MDGFQKNKVVDKYGNYISDYNFHMHSVNKEQTKIVSREKTLDRDMNDLVAYVKWITGDLGVLRDRVRIAEKIISDLKKSGEESVESLLNNLYTQSKYDSLAKFDLEKNQEELDKEAE